jgi:3-oxoacyl-(acyl-carrier-protein) synthase
MVMRCRFGTYVVAGVQPEQASRPFDQERSGFVIGEGMRVILL